MDRSVISPSPDVFVRRSKKGAKFRTGGVWKCSNAVTLGLQSMAVSQKGSSASRLWITESAKATWGFNPTCGFLGTG